MAALVLRQSSFHDTVVPKHGRGQRTDPCLPLDNPSGCPFAPSGSLKEMDDPKDGNMSKFTS